MIIKKILELIEFRTRTAKIMKTSKFHKRIMKQIMKPIMKRINDEWCSYISTRYKTLIELYKVKCNDYDEYKFLYFILLESTSITEELFNELINNIEED